MRIVAATGLFLAACVCATAGYAKPLGNEDVVKLVASGLAEETITLTINSAEETNFDTSADALVALTDAGVPQAVIQAMIRSASGGGTAAPPPARTPSLQPNRTSVLPPAVTPEVGGNYFTRFNFWYERNTHVTTNYMRGTFVPINTPVKLVSLKNKRMRLELPSGEVINVDWAKKFSLRPLAEIATEMLGDQPVDIDALGTELSNSIKAGELRLGMTREQVLMTRGYPPQHRTPELDASRWIYWSSRFVNRTLVFDNGLLVEGRGIR